MVDTETIDQAFFVLGKKSARNIELLRASLCIVDHVTELRYQVDRAVDIIGRLLSDDTVGVDSDEWAWVKCRYCNPDGPTTPWMHHKEDCPIVKARAFLESIEESATGGGK